MIKVKYISLLWIIVLHSCLFSLSTAFAIDDILANYPLNGNTNDASGHGYSGAGSGVVSTTDRFMKENSAYFFNGAGALIEVPGVPASFVGDFTILFWVKSSGSDRMHAISFGNFGSVDNDNLDFDFNDQAGLWVYWSGAGANSIMTGQPGEFTDGVWHQIILQRKGPHIQLYVDGLFRGSAVYTEPIGSSSIMRMGGNSAASGAPFWWRGKIDDVAIYNYALINEDILVNDGMIANYLLNDSTSDASGHGYDGIGSGVVPGADRFMTPNGAYFFNGTGALIEVADIPASFVGDFTISFWINASETYRMHALSFGNFASTDNDNLDFSFNDQAGLWVYWNGAGANAIITGQQGEFTDGMWHQIIFQRLGPQVQLFIDGTFRGKIIYSEPIGSRSIMRMGGNSADNGGPLWWRGMIDDVRVYSQALIKRNLNDNLMAYYQLNDSTSDASGHGNTGIGSGVIPAIDRFMKENSSYFFDGVGALIEVADVPASFMGDFAISFWERSSANDRMHALSFGNFGSIDNDNLDFDFNDRGGLWVYWNGGGANAILAGQPGEFTDDHWHHIIFQRVGAQVQLYIDGAMRGSTVYTEAIGSRSIMRMGGNSSAGGGPYWWRGMIDDVRVFDSALTNHDIGTLTYQWINIKPSPTRNLIAYAYYPLNGNADDASGQGHNGIGSGAIPATDRFMKENSAFDFNGTGALIEVPDIRSLFAGDFAISFWERSSANDRMHALSFGNFGSIDNDNLDFDFNDQGGLWVYWNGGGANAILAGQLGEFTDDNWHHIIFQRVGAQVQLYIDGAMRGSTVYTEAIGSRSIMRMGGNSSAGGGPYWWRGMIDDVRLYERALSNEDMVFLESEHFESRDGAGAVTFNGKMWLLGGWNPFGYTFTKSDIWNSDDGVNWNFIKNAPWEGRHAAGYVSFNNKLWVIGGDTSSGHYQNEVWSSPDGIEWKLETDNVPWANRFGHFVLVYDDKMWLMGGQHTSDQNEIDYNDVYSSSDGINWSKVTDHASWSPRGQILGGAVFAGKMWVIGGGTYNPQSYNNDVWCSTNGIDWELALEHAPWDGRMYHNIASFDGKIWVISGNNSNAFVSNQDNNDVWFSGDGITWNQLPNVPWNGRHAASVFSHDNSLWLVAGSRFNSSQLFSDVWKLTYAP